MVPGTQCRGDGQLETFAKSPAWGLALSKRKPTFLRPFARGGLGSWSTGGVVWGGWRPGQAWSCLGGCDWGPRVGDRALHVCYAQAS